MVKSDDLQNENNLSPFEWDMKDGYPNKKISNNGNNNDDYWIRLLMQQQRQQYQSSLVGYNVFSYLKLLKIVFIFNFVYFY